MYSKIRANLLSDLQISIKRRAENPDGRKDFGMKIVDGMLRMKWKLEDRYAISRRFTRYFQVRIKLFICNRDDFRFNFN